MNEMLLDVYILILLFKIEGLTFSFVKLLKMKELKKRIFLCLYVQINTWKKTFAIFRTQNNVIDFDILFVFAMGFSRFGQSFNHTTLNLRVFDFFQAA